MAVPITHEVIKATRKHAALVCLRSLDNIFPIRQTTVFDLGQIQDRCAGTIVDAELDF
jgi:hypothetical protein